MEIDPKVIAEVIGEGVHMSLRKFCVSSESAAAYKFIKAMPDNEWNVVCEAVADEVVKVVKVIDAHEVDNSFMTQVRKLNHGIDNLAEVIKDSVRL